MYALTDGLNGTVLQYPYSDLRLRRDNIDVSLPDVIDDSLRASYNMYPVAHSEPPAYDETTHRPEQTTPVWNGNQLEKAWSIVALTPEQAQAVQDEILIRDVSADGWVQTFLSWDKDQIETYINGRTNTQLKGDIAKLAIMVRGLALLALRRL